MRRNYPDDEAKVAWLPRLLDSYAVIDEGVAAAIRRQEKESGRKCACGQGCDTCCRTQRDIPVYPHELTGIYWYCMEKIRQPTREVLRQQLLRRRPGDPCPFLMGGSCIVHPLRPTGCRQFNVFGRACEEGEDPFHSRREDVLTPDREVTRRAFALVLGFYGIDEETGRKKGMVESLIRSQVVNLPGCDWWKLAERMKELDERRPGRTVPPPRGEGGSRGR